MTKTLRYLICLLTTLLILSALSSYTPVTAYEPASEQLTPTGGQVEANGITIAYERFGATD